jgi:hypothetical protein
MAAEERSAKNIASERRERPPMTPAQIETWVDQTIRQAQRRGDFDELPGAGKPLTSLDRPDDPDWWIKDLIQREKIDLSAALPGPMALRRERETYPESLLQLPNETAVREVLEDFNARVIADRKRPYAGQGSPAIVGRVDVEQMLERWVALRAAVTEVLGSSAEPSTTGSTSDALGTRSRRPWWRRRGDG